MADKTPFWHKNFAHRGLHDIENKIPENSLAAFKAAAASGYGVELDVQLSKDGQVVVFHDRELMRMCGVPGTVDEYDYSKLSQIHISNTDETITLFEEVLKVFDGTGLPIIVEIKMGKKNKELCKKTYDLLRSYDVIYCVESFNPIIVRWFKKNAPEVLRGQLSGSENAFLPVPSKFVVWLLMQCAFIFLNDPDFIAYENCKRPKRILKLRKKGLMLIGWTSQSPGVDQSQNDAVIFEGYRPDPEY